LKWNVQTNIENLSQVRTKLATAAERFTAVPREKTSAGKVEIIDDDNDVIEDDFKDEDIEDEKNDITFGDNVLMPLVPGNNISTFQNQITYMECLRCLGTCELESEMK